jgi:hypothetical protein
MLFNQIVPLTIIGGFMSSFALADSGFINSCNSYRIISAKAGPPNNLYLSANCRYSGAGAAYNVGTQINLNNFFGNSNGNIVPDRSVMASEGDDYRIENYVTDTSFSGNFVASCKDFGPPRDVPSGPFRMTATCGDGHGGWNHVSIDLSKFQPVKRVFVTWLTRELQTNTLETLTGD